MVKIYINTILPTEELTSENFTEAFDVYAAKLEKLTKVFKNFSKYVKKHTIQVKNVDGYSSSGTFEVDEIDAGRLKKAGFVVDYEELESEPEIPAFYIDKNLDAVLQDTAESLENLGKFPDQPAQVSLEFPTLPEGELEETLTFNLAEVLDPDIELEGDLLPGHMVLQVFPQDGDSHKFNLIMLDFYSDPAEFKLDRERMVFCYKEKDDDEWREKPIQEVFHSLKTANALLSNIVIMVRENPFLFETLGSLDQDLRFLQQLLAFDYALDENDDKSDEPEDPKLDPDFEV
jgi:hypothetical protein